MLTFNGKYNSANVMIDQIDGATMSQIYGFLNHPAFKGGYIAIMPDCHKGEGSCIGFTKQLNSYVIPNVVGVDIGCGVDAYNLGNINIDFAIFDAEVRRNMPAGRNSHTDYKTLTRVLPWICSWDALIKLCDGINHNRGAALRQIGTLGGGNHFVEIDEAPSGDKWLIVHSGSRKLGKDVADFHQKKAKKLMETMFADGVAFKGLEYLPLELGGKDYLVDMRVAQEYAVHNRHVIAHEIWCSYKYRIDGTKTINETYEEASRWLNDRESVKSVHNYIGSDNIIRKGAISAYDGEDVIIPFNMRDGVMIGVGKGSKKWNYSAPHGCGRLYSRSTAKEMLDLGDFIEDMSDVWTSSVNAKTLDESPRAYKDKDEVLKNIDETVDVRFFMKPLYNFKSDK